MPIEPPAPTNQRPPSARPPAPDGDGEGGGGGGGEGLHHRLARALVETGATTLFGLPGGGPNLDVIGAATGAGLRFVLAHGETAAAIMASTHGLLTTSPTPVVVTRGPGAASATNGLAQATLDRYPLVLVADTVPQVSTHRVAHQRLDQRALLAPAAKRSATLSDQTTDDELASLVGAATRWPFGGIHLDYDPSAPDPPPPTSTSTGPDTGAPAVSPAATSDPGPEAGPGTGPAAAAAPGAGVALEAARALLATARRPVVIAGMEAAVVPGLGAAIEQLGCPVLTTYQAIGIIPTEGPDHAGLFTNGASERPLLDQADLVLTVGLDLVEPIPAPWAQTADVIRLSTTIQHDDYLPATIDLVGPLVATLDALGTPETHWAPDTAARYRAETRRRLAAPATHPDPDPGPAPTPTPTLAFGPLDVVDELSRHRERWGTVTVDAGAHFLAVMPHWPVSEPLRLLISNGLATMGFALPAAIGAALARPGEEVLALTGDGGLSMVLAELETLARLELPITVVVFNDSALSLIEIKQGAGHGGSEAVRFHPVDFAATARAAGVEGLVVESAPALRAAIERPPSDPGNRGPRLIDARIDPSIYPHLIEVTRG